MRQRCYDPANASYEWYGARGIAVCERWRDSFPNFYADMGDPPPGHSLDRIRVGEDYSPSNCRWASAVEQNNNRTNNVVIQIGGQSRTAAEWSRIYGIEYTRVTMRLCRGWDPVRAVTHPLIQRKGKETQNALI